jgi:hypothetical protein
MAAPSPWCPTARTVEDFFGRFESKKALSEAETVPSEMSLMFSRASSASLKGWKALSRQILANFSLSF